MTLTVWTVLWVDPEGKGFAYKTPPAGQREQDEVRRYGPEDVQKFAVMVKRWADRLGFPAFRCLSNVEIPGVETVPLACPDLKGWWGKMELFRPGVAAGRNLYFDLDTVIVADPAKIAEFPAPFAAIKPGFLVGSNGIGFRKNEPWQDQEGRWRVPGYQTSVMVWDADYGHKFWEWFNFHEVRGLQDGESPRAAWMSFLASDQDFLAAQFPNEAKLPSRWFARVRSAHFKRAKSLRVVLTIPMRNDSAARLYPWLKEYWPYGDRENPRPGL